MNDPLSNNKSNKKFNTNIIGVKRAYNTAGYEPFKKKKTGNVPVPRTDAEEKGRKQPFTLMLKPIWAHNFVNMNLVQWKFCRSRKNTFATRIRQAAK